MGSFWGRLGVDLGSSCGIVLGSYWDYFGGALGIFLPIEYFFSSIVFPDDSSMKKEIPDEVESKNAKSICPLSLSLCLFISLSLSEFLVERAIVVAPPGRGELVT